MSRRYTRTFSTNAEPSRANWTEGQPRTCSRCGKALRITKDSIFMRRFPVLESFHAECL